MDSIWTDAQFNDDHFQETADRRYYTCKLASYPGPSKGLGTRLAGLEATCKHIEVKVKISLGKSVRDVTTELAASPQECELQYH